MAVVFTPESEYAKEMRKWNAHHSEYGPPGRPYEYREYPMQMYRATRAPSGDRLLDSQRAETEHERSSLEALGYVAGGPGEAVQALERQEREYATLAAEINYDARHGMGEKARVEVEQAQAAAGARHLPAVPVTPIKKRGRPVKVAPVVGE